MTRCRCAECGAVLAIEYVQNSDFEDGSATYMVHPCGACLQEARKDALSECQQLNEELDCPLDTRTGIHELEQSGRD